MKKLNKFINYITEKNIRIYIYSLVITLLIFGIVIKGDFIWDEKFLILGNKHVDSMSNVTLWFTSSVGEGAGRATGLYRPIATMVNSTMVWIFGKEPIAFHLLNILIHSINGLLLFKFLSKKVTSKILTLGVLTIFLIHPVQAESVSYIAGLPDLLSATFILLAILAFERKSNFLLKVVSVSIFSLLGCMTKESALAILPLLILIQIFFGNNKNSKNEKLTLAILTIILIIFWQIRTSIISFDASLGLAANFNVYTDSLKIRILSFISAIYHYCRLIVFPADLQFEKEFRAYAIFKGASLYGIIILIFGTILTVKKSLKNKEILFWYLWFFILLFPVSGILIPTNAVYYEHWLYLPIIPAILLFLHLCKILENKKRFIGIVIFGMVFIALCGRTFYRNIDWADKERFLKKELPGSHESPRLLSNLGTHYFDEKKYEKALHYYSRSLAGDKDNTVHGLRNNIGNTYLALKDIDNAVKFYFEALRINPNATDPLTNLLTVAMIINHEGKVKYLEELIARRENGEELTFEEILKVNEF